MGYRVLRQHNDRRRWPLAAAVMLVAGSAGAWAAAPLFGDEADDGYSVRMELPAAAQREPAPAPSPLVVAPATDAPPRPASLDETQADAVASAPSPAPAVPAATLPAALRVAPGSRVPGVMALRFSLGERAVAKPGGAIEVEKPVSVAGIDAGRIPIRIDDAAHVYALGSRLAAIIAAQSGQGAVPAGLDEDYVSLDRLRALGIAVRYDAARDRLVIDPPAA